MRPALANIITARVPEADTLIDTMTVRPQGNRAFLISDTIRRLKAADIWAKLDVLWMLAAHDAQAARLNWKTPASFALTAVNSPTFTADRGYAGNGTTSYLNTGWNPSTNGVQHQLDNACYGAIVNAGTDADSGAVSIGGLDGVGNGSQMRPRNNSPTPGTISGRLNQTTTTEFSGSSTTIRGTTLFDRSASTLVTAYRNGLANGTLATVSSSRPNVSLWIGAASNNGAFSSGSDFRVSMALAGGSLTSAQHATLYSITQSHLAALGAT